MLIRNADTKDKSRITEMTKEIWDGEDYIKNVFDKWIDTPGEFTILEDDGEIVGCAKLSIIKPNNLWLEGIRVNPNKRRKGYAKLLVDHQLELCRKLGFDHLNLSTWYQNESVKMLDHYPFKLIHEYKELTYDLDEPFDYISDNNVEFEKVLKYFQPLFNETYYACDYTFFTLDDYLIKVFFERGEIYNHGSEFVILSNLYNKDNSLSIVYVNQIDDEFMSIVKHLKKDKKMEYFITMIDDENKIESFIQNGFEGYEEEKFDVYLYEFQKT